ncbi:hypothetical protein DM992_03975 [Burkholderia sp. JP2-270]|nr:hypothetical protein DM992_03975 [Burkholderia sp. JP2-270]
MIFAGMICVRCTVDFNFNTQESMAHLSKKYALNWMRAFAPMASRMIYPARSARSTYMQHSEAYAFRGM